MTQTDIRITELMTRLTALERERAAIVAEIETLQSAPSEQTLLSKLTKPAHPCYNLSGGHVC